MRALLDINVLIALLDAQHVHHEAASEWLRGRVAGDGWASCPLTQNGVVRIMSQPAYPGAQPVARVAARLTEATETRWHAFWPDDVSLLEAGIVDWQRVLASRQVTDVYLLALAARHQGRFVTLDRRIDPGAVAAAGPEHLEIIRP
ncbi:MAG: TA system VapC family ribonuclease toxin [Candidatus Wenzhouxiangella sp. M2_3B_020]